VTIHPDRMAALGHQFGSGLAHDESRTFFLPIPECGDLSGPLVDAGFVEVDEFVKPRGWTSIAVVRDPFHRAVAGLRSVLRANPMVTLDRLVDVFVERVTERRPLWIGPLLDVHVLPQAWFFPPWNRVDRLVDLRDVSSEVFAKYGIDVEVGVGPVTEPGRLADRLLPYRVEVVEAYRDDAALVRQARTKDYERCDVCGGPRDVGFVNYVEAADVLDDEDGPRLVRSAYDRCPACHPTGVSEEVK
jgi:hypothetical protein